MRKLITAVILILSIHSLNAQLKQKLAQAIDKIEPKCIEWRRQIHQNPELYFTRGKLVNFLHQRIGISG